MPQIATLQFCLVVSLSSLESLLLGQFLLFIESEVFEDDSMDKRMLKIVLGEH